jgi:hypothetical protein
MSLLLLLLLLLLDPSSSLGGLIGPLGRPFRLRIATAAALTRRRGSGGRTTSAALDL